MLQLKDIELIQKLARQYLNLKDSGLRVQILLDNRIYEVSSTCRDKILQLVQEEIDSTICKLEHQLAELGVQV